MKSATHSRHSSVAHQRLAAMSAWKQLDARTAAASASPCPYRSLPSFFRASAFSSRSCLAQGAIR